MKRTKVTLFSAFVLAVASVACACGGEKQMHATAPVAKLAEPPGRASMQAVPRVANTPTASNISISPDVLRACNIPDADAYFAFDSANLATFDHGPLDAVVTCFTRGPLVGRKMQLVGHADPRGTSEYNMTLGQSRADAVAFYLDGRGLNRARMETSSRGAMDARGTDETGWAHDRRVDVLLGK